MKKLYVTPTQRDAVQAVLRETADALPFDRGLGMTAFYNMVDRYTEIFDEELSHTFAQHRFVTLHLLVEGETHARLVEIEGEQENVLWKQEPREAAETVEITVKAGDRLVVRVAGEGEVDVTVV